MIVQGWDRDAAVRVFLRAMTPCVKASPPLSTRVHQFSLSDFAVTVTFSDPFWNWVQNAKKPLTLAPADPSISVKTLPKLERARSQIHRSFVLAVYKYGEVHVVAIPQGPGKSGKIVAATMWLVRRIHLDGFQQCLTPFILAPRTANKRTEHQHDDRLQVRLFDTKCWAQSIRCTSSMSYASPSISLTVHEQRAALTFEPTVERIVKKAFRGRKLPSPERCAWHLFTAATDPDYQGRGTISVI